MNKKKIWLSVGLIILVAGGAIATTAAYFTAQRTASANKFTTGTLDLSVSSANGVVEPFIIENMGADADISGTKTWTVKNTGTLPGRFLVRLQDVANKENGCNDQEKAAEAACADDDLGELGGVVTLNVALDGVDKVSSTLATVNQTKIGTDWNALTPITLQPAGTAGDTITITAHWAAPADSYGNEIQSDSVQYNMNFRLIQLNAAGPTPAND